MIPGRVHAGSQDHLTSDLTTGSSRARVKRSSTMLDYVNMSKPTLTFPLHGRIIPLYNAANSDHTFYFMPVGALKPDTVQTLLDVVNGQHVVTFTIQLWDNVYLDKAASLLTEQKHPILLPMPFSFFRLISTYEFQGSRVDDNWAPLANTLASVTGRIPCQNTAHCTIIATAVKDQSDQFTSTLMMSFSFTLPKARNTVADVVPRYLFCSSTFNTIENRFGNSGHVYLHPRDVDEIARDILMCVTSKELDGGEYIEHKVMEDLVQHMASFLVHNKISSDDYNETMWNSTYWADERYRQDNLAKAMGIMAGSQKNCRCASVPH
ncbi:uncharacterized protein LOC129590575 [Paramacrobiotus metropolitanus]|uniref:uncharacterized protein LOC129590575 n=1 Tax=Paramacrobiotus metropolitanus TaxID=2943436 RepID=UPI0024462CDA|nr:uncharacterized protein LOC129590575 [Paramacrobiotus metropolitanus]